MGSKVVTGSLYAYLRGPGEPLWMQGEIPSANPWPSDSACKELNASNLCTHVNFRHRETTGIAAKDDAIMFVSPRRLHDKKPGLDGRAFPESPVRLPSRDPDRIEELCRPRLEAVAVAGQRVAPRREPARRPSRSRRRRAAHRRCWTKLHGCPGRPAARCGRFPAWRRPALPPRPRWSRRFPTAFRSCPRFP